MDFMYATIGLFSKPDTTQDKMKVAVGSRHVKRDIRIRSSTVLSGYCVKLMS